MTNNHDAILIDTVGRAVTPLRLVRPLLAGMRAALQCSTVEAVSFMVDGRRHRLFGDEYGSQFSEAFQLKGSYKPMRGRALYVPEEDPAAKESWPGVVVAPEIYGAAPLPLDWWIANVEFGLLDPGSRIMARRYVTTQLFLVEAQGHGKLLLSYVLASNPEDTFSLHAQEWGFGYDDEWELEPTRSIRPLGEVQALMFRDPDADAYEPRVADDDEVRRWGFEVVSEGVI